MNLTRFLMVSMLLSLITIFVIPISANGKVLVEWDFSKGKSGWIGNNRVENLSSFSEGLLIKSTGQDPWIEGPSIDLSGEEIIRLTIRMKSNADTSAEVFYGKIFRAGHSVRFTTRNDDRWHDYNLVIREKLGSGTRFRLDPCTGPGQVTVAFIKVDAIKEITLPLLERPKRPKRIAGRVVSVRSGNLEFEQYGNMWGNYIVKINGAEMAAGYESELIGTVVGELTEWLNLKDAEVLFEHKLTGEFISKATIKDSRGAEWEFQQSIKPATEKGTLIIEAQLKVNQDRDIVHIPWLTIFPGLGTFSERKYQALLAGVEYLCDEPSSSTADIETSEHIRRVPDPIKITFPLMAVSHNGNYIGLIWEPTDMVAATFDSPDRIYNSGAHVMALSGPAVGEHRFENDYCAHTPLRVAANEVLKISIQVIGGEGKTVVPAIKQYVELKGLPEVRWFEGGFDAAASLLVHGWLDSQINHDGLFRHAVWGNSFPPTPAADAAAYIDWLSNHCNDTKLCERLVDVKSQALGKIPSGQPFSSSVGHARLPAAPFYFRAYV